jgi:hypothetical protein
MDDVEGLVVAHAEQRHEVVVGPQMQQRTDLSAAPPIRRSVNR